MNTVSLFLYAADVVANLSATLTGLAITTMIVVGSCGIPACIGKFDDVLGDGTFFDKYWMPMLKWAIPLCIGIFVLVTFIPSKTTMYAIAASQIGEVAMVDPEVRDAISDTKSILRDYLKSLKRTDAK